MVLNYPYKKAFYKRGRNMKRKLLLALLSITLIFSTVAMSSCYVVDLDDIRGDASGEDYMTKQEVEKLIAGIEAGELTVNSGDNYNVSIESDSGANLLAASRGLLSAVSITCSFEVVHNSYFGNNHTTSETSAGAGVIYSLDKDKGDAYIITNYHVVYCKGASTQNDISDDIDVFLYGMEYAEYAIPASYVGGSPNYDIAVLRIEGSEVLRGSNAMAASFADSNKTSILETAIAIGNPEAKGISATVGSVNVDSETITMNSMDGSGTIALRVLRIDAAVNGGNSGGGLFNDKGEIIGIVNAKMSDSTVDNIGYAIPSNIAKYVADNIIYYDNQNLSNDTVKRILIGINVGIKRAYTVYDTETGKVHKMEDVRISSVSAGGAAEGKLSVDDVIKAVTVDGVKYDIVRTFNVIDVMLTVRQSSSVVFHIERGGAAMDVEIDVGGIQLKDY